MEWRHNARLTRPTASKDDSGGGRSAPASHMRDVMRRDAPSLPPNRAEASARGDASAAWSKKMWTGTGREDAAIGIGRATGESRVPQSDLVRDPGRIEEMARELAERVRVMESEKLALVDDAGALAAGEWAAIVGQFRVLTMSVTASGVDASASDSDLRRVAVYVYEAAADASLLGGNLGFYCTCQSRLLGDLYPQMSLTPARATEFRALSLLYYAIYAQDKIEVACHLRGLSPVQLEDSRVRFGLKAASLRACGRNFDLIKLCTNGQASRRQRTIMQPVLADLRRDAMKTMAKAYMCLDSRVAAIWLGFSEESSAPQTLLIEHLKSLSEVNNVVGAPVLQFRNKRQK